MQYFGSNIVEGVAESWVEVEMSWVQVDGAGWSWVHGLVIPISLRQTSFAGFILLFDKQCGLTTFRWLHLFIAFTQVVFPEEFCFIETTLLPILDQSNEIHFAASWWALIISGRCNNTFFK